MKIKEAEEITGGLSKPSKMPERAYNISAFDCNVGSKLAQIKDTVCSGCYARKGRYRFPKVQKALKRRSESLTHRLWVRAMVTLIAKQSPNYFRWHDSGDLQSSAHLLRICSVAIRTPDTQHWLPTKEIGLVKQYLVRFKEFPSNLCVRVSAPFIDCFPKLPQGVLGSMVYSKDLDPILAFKCPAYTQGGKCGDCRACWGSNPVVAYPKH